MTACTYSFAINLFYKIYKKIPRLVQKIKQSRTYITNMFLHRCWNTYNTFISYRHEDSIYYLLLHNNYFSSISVVSVLLRHPQTLQSFTKAALQILKQNKWLSVLSIYFFLQHSSELHILRLWLRNQSTMCQVIALTLLPSHGSSLAFNSVWWVQIVR